MPKYPVLKAQEVKRLLKRHGFVLVRQSGSHCNSAIPMGEAQPCQIIPEARSSRKPDHPGRDISPVLLRKIAQDIGQTMDEFLGV